MPKKRFNDNDYAEMAAMREAGKKPRAIARRFGCSIGLVAWTCLKLGADDPGAASRPTRDLPPLTMRNGFPVRGYTPEDDAILLEMDAAGDNYTAIGKRLGRMPNSIKGRLMTLARREARAEARESNGHTSKFEAA